MHCQSIDLAQVAGRRESGGGRDGALGLGHGRVGVNSLHVEFGGSFFLLVGQRGGISLNDR